MSSDLVLVTQTERHALVTLNRPAARNPLPYLRSDGLLPALETLAADPNIRAVILTGAPPAFCSGLDLEALKQLQTATRKTNRADAKAIRLFFEFIREYPKPLIAAVNGPAVAGGAGLALLCDVAIWSDAASLCFSEVKIGFVPALVGVYAQRLWGTQIARELLLSGRTLKPDEALRLGIAREVVPAADLLSKSEAWARKFYAVEPHAFQITKILLNEEGNFPLKDALKRAGKLNAEARMLPGAKEGVAAFLEKRPPNWA